MHENALDTLKKRKKSRVGTSGRGRGWGVGPSPDLAQSHEFMIDKKGVKKMQCLRVVRWGAEGLSTEIG